MSKSLISAILTKRGRYQLIVLYYVFRLLVCVPPAVVLFTRSAPDANLLFGPGLVVYVVFLGVGVATAYTWLLRPIMLREHDGLRKPRMVATAVVIGIVDMVGGLVAIILSGGWGSPFWHFWLTSLIIPCVVIGTVWSLVLSAVWATALTAALTLFADDVTAVWTGTHRHLYVGSMITLLLLSGVVGYLGDIGFELQRSRRRAEAALNDLGTVLEITRAVAVITTNVSEMMNRVARTIGERHHYDSVGIYITGVDSGDMTLAGWTGNADGLRRYARQAGHVIYQAANERASRFIQENGSWIMAMPIRDDGSVVGVLLVSSDGPSNKALGDPGIGNALVSQLAVGIRIADLRQQAEHARSHQEWELLTGQIHNSITGSVHALSLLLEAYADTAVREDNPLAEQLTGLVSPSRGLLLETRQYLYHLLPVLRGHGRFDTALEKIAAEFGEATGIPVRLTVEGDRKIDVLDVVGFYLLLQYRLADILRSGTASEVALSLSLDSRNIRLSISDDGSATDTADEENAGNLGRMKLLAQDMGVSLRIAGSENKGLRVVMDLETRDCEMKFDNAGNRQQQRVAEAGPSNSDSSGSRN